jgi:hypothetical protein
MSATSTPTTIGSDFAGGSTRRNSGAGARSRVAWIAGSVAALLVAGAVALAWSQSWSQAVDVTPQAGAVSDLDVMAHGRAGHVVDGRGTPLGSVSARWTEDDLLAHGGEGSAWTVSGSRIR